MQGGSLSMTTRDPLWAHEDHPLTSQRSLPAGIHSFKSSGSRLCSLPITQLSSILLCSVSLQFRCTFYWIPSNFEPPHVWTNNTGKTVWLLWWYYSWFFWRPCKRYFLRQRLPCWRLLQLSSFISYVIPTVFILKKRKVAASRNTLDRSMEVIITQTPHPHEGACDVFAQCL